jgi:predicted dinucleotide-utilizing enzyme
LGGVLDSIDFKTVHDPSAIGTVACFKTVLRHYCLRQDISFGIVGVGELGSRILKLLRSTVKTNILVCDTDPNKVTTACETSGVLASTLARMIGNGLDAVIFCANSGSLSGATASSLAASQSVIAAGGPEAGLDHEKAALCVLTAARKHFIPSVLCGAMGLVANIEELNGKPVDLYSMRLALEARVSEISALAQLKNICFHEAFLEYLGETPQDKDKS